MMAQQRQSYRQVMRETRAEFFQTEEAARIGDQMILYQRETGAWPKNTDMVRRLTDRERNEVLAAKKRTDDSTIDNGATTSQMIFLARLYQATGEERFREAFLCGLEYLLSGQYENGGWPQIWPNTTGYHAHITFNDDAIANILFIFDNIRNERAPYEGALIDKATRKLVSEAFDKGIECILKCQMVVDGKLTVWCQQHDKESYAPAPARAFEHISYCSMESASLVRLLMTLPNPSKKVKAAVHGAMQWFDTYKLTGLKLVRTGWRPGEKRDAKLIPDAEAKMPLWGRFYDLDYCEPYVCDRDGIKRRRLEQIGLERRTGYSWYGSRPADLYPLYEEWAEKYDPKHKVAIDLASKGANENGTIDMYRKPTIDRAAFDVVVKAGESIQAAIEKAPEQPTEPFKILISKGTYNEKVIIDKPNIVLVGEDREETKLIYAEVMDSRKITEYKGKPVGNGVIVIQEGADDCIISGLTVYNNYGTTVENTTRHQMAIFGRATRTIVINSNVWADGNDALSLWARGGNGMYYHADLYLRCPGVDFLCPRGWCFVTRTRFYGDSRAMIWHDGRGDKSKKLVIIDSEFDAATPTLLGRYHHDSQFFLQNCTFSKNVLDGNIHYAYSDKVLDPCPWGQRTYYNDCMREGGHSGWMSDNFHTSEEKPIYYSLTPRWTFNNAWDPESRIRELWHILGY
ncbi:MAG: pectate lyase [Rikenellaceae bacterium]|nr:pectate lyase [Rikenellaceae bacterium]